MKTEFLREAIQLSLEKIDAGEGGPFGAVIVRGDQIVGRGWNRVVGTNDPTAHAEVVAIRDACARLQTFSLEGCEIFCSCEPCPMCLAAILWARIDRVFFAATSADAAAAGFDDAVIHRELTGPVEGRSTAIESALRDEAAEAFEAWLQNENRIMY